jgi:hypothetical protein
VKSIGRRLGWHYAACEKACGDLVRLVGDVGDPGPAPGNLSPLSD